MKQGIQSKVIVLKTMKLGIVIAISLLTANTSFGQGKWVAPAEAKSKVNPLAGNNSGIADAKKLYLSTCAPCHGDKGKGDGAAAASLNPKPADHTSKALQAETDGELFWKITEGRKAMPGWKSSLTEQQRWSLVNYIRTLAKK